VSAFIGSRAGFARPTFIEIENDDLGQGDATWLTTTQAAKLRSTDRHEGRKLQSPR